MESSTPFVSFIIITKNSANRIHKCLLSIEEIDYPKDCLEIMVIDAGSKDGTVEIAEQYGGKVILYEVNGPQCLGVTQGAFSKSRNAGLAIARGELVAFVDDDAVLSREWLKELVEKAFQNGDVAGATGLNFLPAKISRIGRYIGVLPLSMPSVEELAPLPFLKSDFTTVKISQDFDVNFACGDYMISAKHCIYRKSALEEVGKFDEKAFADDDTDVNARLLKKGYKLAFIPEAKSWHEPRQNLRSLFKQQIRYGLGVSHSLQKYVELIRLRWFVPPLGMLSLFVLTALSFVSNLAIMLLISLLLTYLLFQISYGVRAAMKHKDLDMIVGVPLVCIVWQLSWCFGFLYGLIFRRPQPVKVIEFIGDIK